MKFDKTPFIAIWEITQACELSCRHCRAEAQPLPLPGELSHEEGMDLVDQIADMGTSVLVFTGGDPLSRGDLLDLVRHAKKRKMRVATIPAATNRVTKQHIVDLKEAGLTQLAQSLDFASAKKHDDFRRVPGTFDKTLQILGWAREAGLPVQVNTVFHGGNAGEFPALAELVKNQQVVFWEIFFLVPTGRGKEIHGLSAAQVEDLFGRIYAFSKTVPFFIKVTEAPHYHRYYVERKLLESGHDPLEIFRRGRIMPEELTAALGPRGTIGRAPEAVNSGKGFVFISYKGDVYPSGFLPITGGNVRKTPLAGIYRDSKLFQDLRNPDLLGGRCGRCPFKKMCGGSRSRAFAITGDWLQEDPWCAYHGAALCA